MNELSRPQVEEKLNRTIADQPASAPTDPNRNEWPVSYQPYIAFLDEM